MAHRQPTSLRSLLPSVLTRLSVQSGDMGAFFPVWRDVVGEVTARHCKPLALDGSTLVVRVESPRWAAALTAQEPEVLRALSERLGEGRIQAFVYRSVEPR
jgi:predicted nucleic acid-binding Zn ribbon protein